MEQMHYFKKRTVALLVAFLAFRAAAQEDLGIRNSNRAGIQGSLINPSSIAGSPLEWDLHLFSAQVDFANTFLYAKRSQVPFLGIRRIIKGSIDEDLFLTRYEAQDPNKRYQVNFTAEFLGPSFFITVKNKHEIGLTTALRGIGNIRDITGNAGQNAFDYLLASSLWNTTYKEQSARINGMGWMEWGLHYATVLFADGWNELKAGVALKYEQGMFAVYVKNTNLTYRIADTSGLIFTNSSVDYGRTDFGDFRRRNFHNFDHGHGFGVDLGLTFVHKNNPADDRYLYRVGLSLLDAGKINYDRNTGSYHLSAAAANFSGWHETQFADNNQLDRTLSAVFYNGDSSRSMTGNSFHMALPTALSVQADWDVTGSVFADVTIVQGFGHGKNVGVTVPDVYSLTARYETKWWEVSVPVSLIYYGHWQPRVGIAIRAAYFFIGGDAPGALFRLNDLGQVDFYAGIHYFMPSKSTKAPLFTHF